MTNDPEKVDFWSTFDALLTFMRVIFHLFWCQKSRFLNFVEAILELFRKCLGIIFGPKGHFKGGFLALKVDFSFGVCNSPINLRISSTPVVFDFAKVQKNYKDLIFRV